MEWVERSIGAVRPSCTGRRVRLGWTTATRPGVDFITSDPFPSGNLVRINYERGLLLLKAEAEWIVPSSERLCRTKAGCHLARDSPRNRASSDLHVTGHNTRKQSSTISPPCSSMRLKRRS